MADVVDWDLAVATGLRRSRAARTPSGRAAEAVAELRAARDAGDRTGAGAHPAGRPGRLRRDGRRGPAGVAAVQRRRFPDRAGADAGPMQVSVAGPGAAVTAVGSRATGAAARGGARAGCRARCSGSTRRSPRPAPRRGCCSWRPTSSTVERRPRRRRPRLPAVGRACTRRPTACSSPRCPGWPSTCIAEVHALARGLRRRRRRGRSGGCRRCSGRGLRGAATAGRRWSTPCRRPAQREVFDRLTALMSLLEGHADHVMDDVGPDVVPTRRG